jgi:hypothetical protein
MKVTVCRHKLPYVAQRRRSRATGLCSARVDELAINSSVIYPITNFELHNKIELHKLESPDVE